MDRGRWAKTDAIGRFLFATAGLLAAGAAVAAGFVGLSVTPAEDGDGSVVSCQRSSNGACYVVVKKSGQDALVVQSVGVGESARVATMTPGTPYCFSGRANVSWDSCPKSIVGTSRTIQSFAEGE